MTTKTTERAIRLNCRVPLPGAFVAGMLAQSGLTRDQLRWGINLGTHWRMISPAALARWVRDDDVISLDEALLYVGAGDVRNVEEYRHLLTID